jgi:hypothetical protein
MAEQKFWRAETWSRTEDGQEGVVFYALFIRGDAGGDETGGYEPGRTVIVQPWDVAWHELAETKGLLCGAPSDFEPPRGLW